MSSTHSLRQAVTQAQNDNDLPDEFARRVLALAEAGALTAAEIQDLIDKLGDYDTYGQTGYLGMGVNNLILDQTLRRLEKRMAADLGTMERDDSGIGC